MLTIANSCFKRKTRDKDIPENKEYHSSNLNPPNGMSYKPHSMIYSICLRDMRIKTMGYKITGTYFNFFVLLIVNLCFKEKTWPYL